MSCVFPSAGEIKSIGDIKAIHDEVCDIESAILQAMVDGLNIITVTNTPMTLSTTHFNVWNVNINQNQCAVVVNNPSDQHLLDLQAQVIACFEKLGYSIVRKTNTVTGNTFYWEVMW